MTVVEFGKENRDVVLLLHGGGLSWWNYRAAAGLLEKEFHVVLPVLDGHGGSGEAFSTLAANAERIIAYIDGCFGGRIMALGGLSLGGQIALEVLSRRPDICRYALIESALAKPMGLTRGLIGPTFSMSYGLIRQRWFAKLQAGYLGIPGELFEDYYRDTCAIAKADMVAFMQANCGYSPDPALAKTQARLLILAGSREQKSILDSSKLLHAAVPGSRMEILPGLRHGDLSINHPERYTKILKDWIRGECL